LLILSLTFPTACEKFFSPEQEIAITENRLFDDWYEYRAVEMGLYSIQAELAEQLMVLGELRADLLQITDFADADLIEIYNFNISKQNRYASPTTFFKLISACNNFVRILERNHPEVLDLESPVTNYDRLYGEVLCMRAWAYFNAVRIYGKIPFIHESWTTIEEVNSYLNAPGEYIDSLDITFARNGYHNDTTYNTPISLDKQYYDQRLIIDYFTNELKTRIKAVGVNHSINNNDETWEVTTWNTYAMNTLLGLMYLTEGDLLQAAEHFEQVIYNNTLNLRYQLDRTFSDRNWRDIFNNIDVREHILVADFNKGSFQKNRFQNLFDIRAPHEYMLMPTRKAIMFWETIWDDFTIANYNRPEEAEIGQEGTPGDFHRGYGVSYAYVRNEVPVEEKDIQEMLTLKSKGDIRTSSLLVRDVDTVVWKYSWNKDVYDEDADFIFYRAASVHLWLAEIYTYLATIQNYILRESTPIAVGLLNDGSNYSLGDREQLGVRGRVGFGGELWEDGARIGNYIYIHDPITNEIIGYRDLTTSFYEKQLVLDQYILDERARELAFEGERFYDLIRAAKRRNDPAYLAGEISEKFPPEKRGQIYSYLLEEENWYIHYFE
jgi:hypothetical protein